VENRVEKALKALNGPILITGHTGFKGTWLTLLLEHIGLEVVGISLPAEEESLYQRMQRLGKIPESFIDIRNFELTQKKIKEFAPTAVIHMAAQPLVLNSYNSPRETFDINVMGTANVLDASFASESVKAVVAVTTDKVYKNLNKNNRFTENDTLSGKDPYSASKVGAEAAISAWQQMALVNDGPRVISVRAGNVIGGGDFAEYRLLPDLIRGFSNNASVSIRNPHSTRPWQHVLDPLNGYLLALAHALEGGNESAFNFGPPEESLLVEEVVKIAANSWGDSAEFIFEQEMNSDKESVTLQLDSTLANKVLNWKPSWDQKASIISTMSWWKKVLLNEMNPSEACLSDISFLLKNE
jgi:CDP-glucose 4,6-dehydratase